MNKPRKIDIIETLASDFKDALNEMHLDLFMDYDDDQREKIEAGREFAEKWLAAYKLIEVE